MERRRFALVAALAISGCLVAACGGGGGAGGGGGTGASGAPEKPVIGVDYPRSDTDFWNSYISYVPKSAEELGVELKTTNSQNDIAKLTANVQTFMGQGVRSVVMAPQDTAAVAPTLQQLEAKKIPAVLVDTRPDTGNAFMVVRADNRAYGEKACRFLGEKLQGKGKVVMLQGDLASINGRDRTEAFNECMKANYAGIKVFGEATKWDGAIASQKLSTVLTANPDVKGVYMQSSFALAGTLQVLKQRDLLVPPDDPKHVFIVSNDGIPQELKEIAAGNIDATVSQPADLYAKWALSYAKDAAEGKTFQPGKTDHDSTIIQVREGLLEDQLSAPLVTSDGGTFGDIPSVKYDDKSLWGNNLS
ncbi:sugar ABC transporter substrate-binding protein [Sphaerisporangium rubeum]|uniref:Simple sugar transport system substrate-binding protein/ribose transport system substrate-binding protein n=1 Tax=Sphaerisporangium rubeum TaxID=321317 RepID=A0A7X0IGU3_9ACTN|nr:sugar ABC transporter substrate-binding protein [Sphaerisporangium rubeum]MBB6474384.1 simple sugar transport system substrate-binding protein/ribose transport system substrate-binding protein [Sphaerisporangium rubeum]